MSSIEHIVLYTILLFSFYFWGKSYYNIKENLDYWRFAIFPIVIFSLIVGSRYEWGSDYLFYKDRFEHAFTFEEEQLGFMWLNQAMSWIGLNYVGAYIVYSLIFVTSAFVFVRSFGKESKYMYAFLIPATLIFVSSAIRQGVALGFVLLALYFFNKRSWGLFLLAILVGTSIHTAVLVTVGIFGITYFIRKWPLDWRITIPLYLFFTFVYDVSKTGFLASYLNGLSLGNKFQSYLDNSDQWFGAEAVNDIYEQSTIALILSSLFYMSIIYLGYIVLKYRSNERIIWFYNTVVIGFILYRVGFNFEILRRFFEPIVMFQFVILGYIVWIFLNSKVKHIAFLKRIKYKDFTRDMTFFKIGLLSTIIYLLLFWGRFIFLSPDRLFFWDK